MPREELAKRYQSIKAHMKAKEQSDIDSKQHDREQRRDVRSRSSNQRSKSMYNEPNTGGNYDPSSYHRNKQRESRYTTGNKPDIVSDSDDDSNVSPRRRDDEHDYYQNMRKQYKNASDISSDNSKNSNEKNDKNSSSNSSTNNNNSNSKKNNNSGKGVEESQHHTEADLRRKARVEMLSKDIPLMNVFDLKRLMISR
jgi:hypothetical protein